MPRFNVKKWTPAADTTPGLKTVDPRAVVLARAHNTERGLTSCPCGCEGFPTGNKSTFVIGHDARMKGILIRAHLTNTQVRFWYVEAQELGDSYSAAAVADLYGWVHYLVAAEERAEGQKRASLDRLLDSRRLVTVGRWEYHGRVVGVSRKGGVPHLQIEYTTKGNGQTKTITVPESETVPLKED